MRGEGKNGFVIIMHSQTCMHSVYMYVCVHLVYVLLCCVWCVCVCVRWFQASEVRRNRWVVVVAWTLVILGIGEQKNILAVIDSLANHYIMLKN